MTQEQQFYEWLDSCPFQWFADEDELGESITVRFIMESNDA